MTPAQRKWEKQKPKAPTPEGIKQSPKVPRNVWRRPVRLPLVAPLTDEDRQAA